jgi:hypothetical protein
MILRANPNPLQLRAGSQQSTLLFSKWILCAGEDCGERFPASGSARPQPEASADRQGPRRDRQTQVPYVITVNFRKELVLKQN